MVPTLTLTSMFDEPSSGSKTMMYRPDSVDRLNVTGSSSFFAHQCGDGIAQAQAKCSSAWFA